jgi:hypothetical protein
MNQLRVVRWINEKVLHRVIHVLINTTRIVNNVLTWIVQIHHEANKWQFGRFSGFILFKYLLAVIDCFFLLFFKVYFPLKIFSGNWYLFWDFYFLIFSEKPLKLIDCYMFWYVVIIFDVISCDPYININARD